MLDIHITHFCHTRCIRSDFSDLLYYKWSKNIGTNGNKSFGFDRKKDTNRRTLLSFNVFYEYKLFSIKLLRFFWLFFCSVSFSFTEWIRFLFLIGFVFGAQQRKICLVIDAHIQKLKIDSMRLDKSIENWNGNDIRISCTSNSIDDIIFDDFVILSSSNCRISKTKMLLNV